MQPLYVLMNKGVKKVTS